MKHFEITNRSQKAIIKIIGEISWWKNNSQDFTRQVDALIKEGVTDLECYINTPGGSMFDANEIGNQVERFTGQKTAILGAICASAGTILSTYFDEVQASNNTQYMMHDPSMLVRIGGMKEWKSQKKLYENLRNDAIDRYVSMTGLKKEEIDAMLEAVTWMNAQELKKKGFVNSIRNEKSKLPEDAKSVLNSYKIDLPEMLNLALEGTEEEELPTNQESKTKTHNMKEIAKSLGLPEDATETQIANAITSLQVQAKFGVEALTATAEAKGLPSESITKLANASFEDALELVNNSKDPETSDDDEEEEEGDEKPKNEGKDKPSETRVLDILNQLVSGATNAGTSEKKWDDYTPKELENLQEKDPKAFKTLLENHTKS